MTIDEAILILRQLERTLAPTMTASGTDAMKLGIEALKQMKAERTIYGFRRHVRMPGETEE
jgi:hypothetical protein